VRWRARQRGGYGALGGDPLVFRDQPHDGLDEREVREGLREVSQVPTGVGIDLLGVEQQRAGEAQQLLAQCPGAGDLPDLGQRGNEPERASQSDRKP